jgi:hypothetical protein
VEGHGKERVTRQSCASCVLLPPLVVASSACSRAFPGAPSLLQNSRRDSGDRCGMKIG